MDRDTITRTGARTPGVGRELKRWHGSRVILPAQNGTPDVTPRPCEGWMQTDKAIVYAGSRLKRAQ